MTNISNAIISLEEAKAALRCMRLSGLSEDESLETLEDFTNRIRKVSTSQLVERIIDTQLTDVQREFMKEYWYNNKNTTIIASEHSISQATVYRTLARASETIKKLMTPLIEYQNDIVNSELVPLYINEIMEICSARNSQTESLCCKLRNLRISYAITAEHLADALKISLKELTEIESGRRIPSITTTMRYSAIFGLEITMEFINGKGVYKCRKV